MDRSSASHPRERGVEHGVLGLDHSRIGEVDREPRLFLGPVCAVLGLVHVVLRFAGVDVGANLGDRLVPASLDVGPPGRDPVATLVGLLAQLLGLLLTDGARRITVGLDVGLGLIPRRGDALLGLLRASRQLAQLVRELGEIFRYSHFQPPVVDFDEDR